MSLTSSSNGPRSLLGLGGKLHSRRRADHHLDQVIDIAVGHFGNACIAAVAQHADAVADLENLFQMVGDKNHRHALALEFAHDLEQQLGLTGRQRRGRLIEHQQACIQGQGLGDFDKLLLGHTQVLDRAVQVNAHPEALEQRLRGLGHFGACATGRSGCSAHGPRKIFSTAVR